MVDTKQLVQKHIKQLATEEGTLIHRNDGEDDITLPYGLYKKYDSKMYKYIISRGKALGFGVITTFWKQYEIDEINEDIKEDKDYLEKLAIEFYEDFIRPAKLNLYPKDCKAVMFSLYINSPKYSIMAVQRSIINMVKSDRIGLLLNEVSREDGGMGSKTEKSLQYIRTKSNDFYYYFEEAIISNMKDIYEELADTPEEQKNLKGWKNRVRKYQQMR